MLSISYLFEELKGYLEKGKVDIPKVNRAFFKRMFAAPEGPKRQKIVKAHSKFQKRVTKLPSSFS